MPDRAWRDAPRPGRRVGLLSLAVALALARTAAGADVDELFRVAREPADVPAPAEERVQAAFDNLFGFDGVVQVQSTTRDRAGAESRLAFRLYRERTPDEMRVLVVTLAPDDVRGRRILEIVPRKGRSRAWIHAPRVDDAPLVTPYRLTDPFLGTFSEREPPLIRANLAELVRAHEIVSRQGVRLRDGSADRITLRPLISRQYESVELVIARDRPVILEYRWFEANVADAARVAVAPPQSMQRVADRWLPGRMFYRDRLQATETELVLRYEPLPERDRADLFRPTRFHRVRIPELEPAGR